MLGYRLVIACESRLTLFPGPVPTISVEPKADVRVFVGVCGYVVVEVNPGGAPCIYGPG